MGVSSYNVAMARNDLSAMRAREDCASHVGQAHFKNIVDSSMRLADAIDSPSSPYKPAAIPLFLGPFAFDNGI